VRCDDVAIVIEEVCFPFAAIMDASTRDTLPSGSKVLVACESSCAEELAALIADAALGKARKHKQRL
jgi:hypothetical protein